ncbi:hypothetical protein IEO21_11139 [Rhodonia placenta]|uniref:Uncharacterized protein n=1 Tax=Rhodonia placenta TaxID=104341 RepID=A0A8H7TUZ7_9APHY|nr:hypothetical protein IEO21_11139 [Postia placenta]
MTNHLDFGERLRTVGLTPVSCAVAACSIRPVFLARHVDRRQAPLGPDTPLFGSRIPPGTSTQSPNTSISPSTLFDIFDGARRLLEARCGRPMPRRTIGPLDAVRPSACIAPCHTDVAGLSRLGIEPRSMPSTMDTGPKCPYVSLHLRVRHDITLPMDLIKLISRVRPASKPSTASLRSSLRNLETSSTAFTCRYRLDEPFDFGYCRRTANRVLAKSTPSNRVSSLYDTSKSSAELRSSLPTPANYPQPPRSFDDVSKPPRTFPETFVFPFYSLYY